MSGGTDNGDVYNHWNGIKTGLEWNDKEQQNNDIE